MRQYTGKWSIMKTCGLQEVQRANYGNLIYCLGHYEIQKFNDFCELDNLDIV